MCDASAALPPVRIPTERPSVDRRDLPPAGAAAARPLSGSPSTSAAGRTHRAVTPAHRLARPARHPLARGRQRPPCRSERGTIRSVQPDAGVLPQTRDDADHPGRQLRTAGTRWRRTFDGHHRGTVDGAGGSNPVRVRQPSRRHPAGRTTPRSAATTTARSRVRSTGSRCARRASRLAVTRADSAACGRMPWSIAVSSISAHAAAAEPGAPALTRANRRCRRPVPESGSAASADRTAARSRTSTTQDDVESSSTRTAGTRRDVDLGRDDAGPGCAGGLGSGASLVRRHRSAGRRWWRTSR